MEIAEEILSGLILDLMPSQAPLTVPEIALQAVDAPDLMRFQPPEMTEPRPLTAVLKKPVMVDHAPEMPLNNPSIKNPPISANTVLGE